MFSGERQEVDFLRGRVFELEDEVRELQDEVRDEQRKRQSLELSYNNLQC